MTPPMGAAVRRDVPLGPHTTYKRGGVARLFVEPADERELTAIIERGIFNAGPVLVLGRGSNLVVADSGFEGVVLKLGKGFLDWNVEGEMVRGGGAVPLATLARGSVRHGLVGLEFLVGIPGSVGGAVRQNAGCFGVEVVDRLIEARIVSLRTGRVRRATVDDLDLSYRQSNVSADEVVIAATFRGEHGDRGLGETELRRITRWRKENQPGGTFNAGSVFKNPREGGTAGEIIDSLGLKGLTVGGVSVSPKHANFFVAGPEATSAEIKELVATVQRIVLEGTGIALEPEIQFVGFDS